MEIFSLADALGRCKKRLCPPRCAAQCQRILHKQEALRPRAASPGPPPPPPAWGNRGTECPSTAPLLARPKTWLCRPNVCNPKLGVGWVPMGPAVLLSCYPTPNPKGTKGGHLQPIKLGGAGQPQITAAGVDKCDGNNLWFRAGKSDIALENNKNQIYKSHFLFCNLTADINNHPELILISGLFHIQQ